MQLIEYLLTNANGWRQK